MTVQNEPQFNINFENVDHSPAIVEYINKKLAKPIFMNANVIVKEVNVKRDHYRGVEKYYLSLLSTVHGKEVFIKEAGDNVNELIDKLFDVLKNKLSKLKDTNGFNKQSPMEFEDSVE